MQKLIDVAMAEVGYLEKKTNSQLESKTANAGSNNYTKYGKAQGCNGQPWCDAFVDWCFIQAYGKDKAKRLLGGFSNYTPTSANYFMNMGAWHTKAQVGDVIFFKNTQRIYHTGIVYKVDAKKVYTIEGNTSGGSTVVANGGGVFKKSYALNNSKIAGYGRPAYNNAIKSLPLIKYGSTGQYVREAQLLLNAKGYSCGTADGIFGSLTRQAVRKYQLSHPPLEVDGIVGPQTWAMLYN